MSLWGERKGARAPEQQSELAFSDFSGKVGTDPFVRAIIEAGRYESLSLPEEREAFVLELGLQAYPGDDGTVAAVVELHRYWIDYLELSGGQFIQLLPALQQVLHGEVPWRISGRAIVDSLEDTWGNGLGQLIEGVIPALLEQGLGATSTRFASSIEEIVEPMYETSGGEPYLLAVAKRLREEDSVRTAVELAKGHLRPSTDGDSFQRPLAELLVYPGERFDWQDPGLAAAEEPSSGPLWRRAINGALHWLLDRRPSR